MPTRCSSTLEAVRKPSLHKPSADRKKFLAGQPISLGTAEPPKKAEMPLDMRAQLEIPIRYFSHPSFTARNAVAQLIAMRPEQSPPKTSHPEAREGQAFVAGLVQAALLTPEEERYLFVKFNFHRFRAEQARQKLLRQANKATWNQFQADQQEASAIRNKIVEANLRLVVSVARKLTPSFDQLSELVSEGLLPLIRAVELFDVSLGNRFSTYATWAIKNHLFRTLKRARRDQELDLQSVVRGKGLCLENGGSVTEQELAENARLSDLSRLLTVLSDREKQIISARFGLNGFPRGQSLAEISRQIGLSKERIRQIVLQAMERMREAAQNEGMTSDVLHRDFSSMGD